MTYPPRVRVYYPGGKAGSFGTLARGFKQAFEAIGVEHAMLDYRVVPDEDGFGVKGAAYDIGLYLGEPTHLGVMVTHTNHRERIVMVAPNGYGVRENIIESLRLYGCRLATPSSWGHDVLAEQFDGPIDVVPHGVDNSPLVNVSPYDVPPADGKLHLLHVTSTASDRKGTRALLEAWAQSRLDAVARLTIKADPVILPSIQALASNLHPGARSCVRIDANDYSSEGQRRLYRRFHAVIQPSAAEGFGCVPLEAAAEGVPAIMTRCTGHSEFAHLIIHVPVAHGERGLVRGEEFDGHPAEPSAIVQAIRAFYNDRDHFREAARVNAATVAERMSWTAVVGRWLNLDLKRRFQDEDAG